MRSFNAGLWAILVLFICGVSSTPLGQQLLGASKCTWGPSYWCDNLSNAKDCKATRHCIQTVWETTDVEVDTDSICKICKDMVTQARDQLRSNETEDEIKQVLEGSCNLIPFKIIKKECSKMADDFVPELIEALSSQMNPDQVCSVAGLCNSAKIDQLLKESYQATLSGSLTESQVSNESKEHTTAVAAPKQLSCGDCNLLAGIMHQKFVSTDRDQMVENMLHMCGSMSSFSDACSNVVLVYFNDIYEHMQEHLHAKGVCHLSGVCSAKFHQHEEDQPEEPPLLAALDVADDIPCELCEQLVRHLRDVLVANTTESEFKQVLEGFCKQSKGFKDQCLSIVDEYYHNIYTMLVNNLDANGACFLMGVCPKGAGKSLDDAPIMPLLPVIQPAEVKITVKKLGAHEPKFTQDEIMSMALPIDHLMGAANPGLLVDGGELCTLCEYVLHFLQVALATPSTDEEIKHEVENVCTKLPKAVSAQCSNFVEMYGDAVIALLVQGLDPRSICPKMQMCPHNIEKQEDIEVFYPVTSSDEQDKPTCPLCLFAVEQAQAKIRDNKSKDNIRKVLNGLCAHLPNKLVVECNDFVETYSNELIDMLITDFKPQEICVQLKLCPKTKNYLDDMGIDLEDDSDSDESSENMSVNEIEFSEDVGFVSESSLTPNCMICEELIKELEKKINKHDSKEDIKKALAHSCDKLRANLRSKCHTLVDKFGDRLADLMVKQLSPKLICKELGQCLFSERENLETLQYQVIGQPSADTKLARLETADEKDAPTCVLCEFIMAKLEMELQNKTEQEEIKKAIQNICNHMPKTVKKQCDSFVQGYAAAIIDLISKVPPKQMCQKMQLCFSAVITDEVIECGVCHGATQALLPYIRASQQRDVLTIQDMTSVACENLPAKYYNSCADMISIYGISIVHMAERANVEQSHVCAEIGKCFDNEKSSLAFVRISA